MLKLYGATMSRAHRVLWMLKELGIPYEHIQTSFLDGSTHRPEFLKINPNGRVPAIDDDGLLMFESIAINLYLAKKYPSSLSPVDITEEGLALQWSFWVVTEIEKPLLLAAANSYLFKAEERSSEEASMALGKLDRPWSVLESHLSNRNYLMGERFTVADLNVATVMDLAPPAGISLHAYPNLERWLERCLHRPTANDWQSVKFTIPRPATPLGMLKMFV